MSILDNLTKEEIAEIPMIEIMHHILSAEKKPIDFYAIMDKIAEYKGWTDAEKQNRIVQAYTDMNIDGRFVSLGDNQWGLKNWYPVEQTEEELATTIKPKKRKKRLEDDDYDEYDDIDELLDDEDVFDDEEIEFEDEEEYDLDVIDEEDDEYLEDDFDILEDDEQEA